MSDIIPPCDAHSKSILTVEEFYPRWAGARQTRGASIVRPDAIDEWLEFAVAYSHEKIQEFLVSIEHAKTERNELEKENTRITSGMYHTIQKKDDLLRRAAELLRSAPVAKWKPWEEERQEWLRDAGMEK